MSIPSVQTYIAKKVTKNLNETYGTSINIERLGLNWRGEVDIREIYIEDHHQDTLIYANQLRTNILSIKNLVAGDLDFGTIKLYDGLLNVKTYKGEEDDNLYVFSEKFNTDKPTSNNTFQLTSNFIALENTAVKIVDENLENPQVIALTDIFTEASDFSITGPDVTTDISSLSFNTDFGLEIKNLSSNFAYTLTQLSLKNLLLETNASIVGGDIILNYEKENGLADFVNKVLIDATLEKSSIATKDLNKLYNEFGVNQTINLEGKIKGILNNFTATNLRLSTGATRISGDYRFENLLDNNRFKISSTNHNIQSNYYDLSRFMPNVIGASLPQEIKLLGDFSLRGNTKLTQTKLVTSSVLKTSQGNADIDVKFGNINDFENATYNGNIALDAFNLGVIAGTSSVGKITANVDVDGKGFTQQSVNTQIIGKVSSFVFEEYEYENITVSGNFKKPLFNGDLLINDPNLKMDFEGLIDVSKDFNQYDFEANIEYAELNKLNLIKRDSISVFAGKIAMDMDGTTIDDAVGTIKFNETFYQNERDDFYFDDFEIISSFNEEERTIAITSSDIVNGQISGKFLVSDIPDLFRNGVGSIYTNYIPNEVTNNQYIDYEFEINNKIIDLFVPQIQLGENTRIKGSVSSDESKFKLNFKSPEILILENYLSKVNIQVDNDNPLYNTYIEVDSIFTGVYNVTDVNLINKTLKDTLYLRSEFKGGKQKDDIFNLSLYHTINPEGKSVVGVKKSDITYKDKVWYLNKNNDKLNKVSFDDNFNTVKIDSLVLNHNNEFIKLAGVVRDSTYKDIKVKFQDVNIGNITPEIDSLRLKGTMNGQLDFLQKKGAYYPNSSVTVDDIFINDVAYGDLKLSVEGNQNLSKYKINTTLTNESVKSITAIGEIDVEKENPKIDLDVDLNDFNLQAFSPFGADVITDIRGLATGNVKVSGNYKSPDMNGRLLLNNSGLNIPFLNTDFDLKNNTQVNVRKGVFEILETTITDTKYNTVGNFDGKATHVDFSNWELDLNFDTNNLLVLDTPPDEDALYYGTAFISGTASIAGPVDELNIDVTAATEENTSFKIPLSDTEAIGDDSFIKFLSPEEKEARMYGETIIREEVKGLTLNFDLDINDKAEVEVVVDPVNNSRLKGRGVGTLLIRINTLGAFNMWGEFTVIEGSYDFRYGGLIQKEIDVVPGGYINWDGIPERARLNLTAKYATSANPSVLLDNPTVNRKIPVNVLVDLTGEILQPEIDFRIEFPKTSSIVRSELEYKLQNPEEREKQALFLVSSGSFVNDNFASAFAANALVDRVSNLVNEIFADQDSKFKVGLNYEAGNRTPNQETADRFGITLSTQINERILINGQVGVPVGGVNETAVAGDIEVQWLVNEDGSLRMNFFNRQADIQFIGEDQIFEQGVGLSYSVDFDTFKELVNKLFNKKITLESEEIPVTPDDNSFPVNFVGEGKNENEN